MRFPFGPKTWSWRAFSRPARPAQGVATLLAAFLAVAFTTIGLGIIRISHVHMRLTAHKKTAELIDHAAENGLKTGCAFLIAALGSAPVPILLTDSEYALLESDAQNQGNQAVKTLLGQDTPIALKGQTAFQSWDSRILFTPSRHAPFENHFSTVYSTDIQATGRILKSPSAREAEMAAELGIRAGRIPLPLIPLLLDMDLGTQSPGEFLAQNNIAVIESGPPSAPPTPAVNQEGLLPEDADGLIRKALKTGIFRPQDLSASQLREAIGLEPGPDPIPQGVYLIQDDLGLGGIYVQGDLTQMILAIAYDYQVVAFRQGQDLWVLMYNPSAPHTRFISPGSEESFDLNPLGIIIVDGNVQSLSGGILDAAGQPAAVPDSEAPCILGGVDLTIVCSDKLVLDSHLIQQGVRWQDGVPYLKDSDSQLHLLATGRNILGQESGEGKIIIGAGAPAELKIEANLTASQGGITVEGTGKTVDLLGSLHFSDYQANGNSLRLHPDTRLLGDESRIRNAPHTRLPILIYTGLRMTLWRARQ